MSDTRYPTRMHGVLGVEVDEEATYKSTTKEFEFFVDEYGSPRHLSRLLLDGYDMANIINHPERIIRKPRLSEEQVKQLQALVTLGFRWLIKNSDNSAFSYTHMPEKMDTYWDGVNAYVQIFIDLPTGVLYDLVSWSDPEPLDIVKTLRDAGVVVSKTERVEEERK